MSAWTSTSRSPVMDLAELSARLTLRALPGLRDAAINALIAEHGSAVRALRQPTHILELGARTLPDRVITERVRANMRAIREHNVVVLTPDSPEYPWRLKKQAERAAPPLLFAIGNIDLLNNVGIAVVGSRAMSEYGHTMTEELTGGVTLAGYTIISGLALGVDAVAHATALDAGGETIAVVGNGVDVIYPTMNRMLRERIIRHGVVVSQFQPGERPAPWHFPERNFVMAAMSEGVLVVEAAARSGATITSHHAGDLGIISMAVPGPVGKLTSAGSNRLLREGVAGVVTCVADICEDMHRDERVPQLVAQLLAREARRGPKVDPVAVGHPDDAGGSDGARVPGHGESAVAFNAVRAVLTLDPCHLDDIVTRTQLPTHVVVASLLELECAGLARQHPGARYQLRSHVQPA